MILKMAATTEHRLTSYLMICLEVLTQVKTKSCINNPMCGHLWNCGTGGKSKIGTTKAEPIMQVTELPRSSWFVQFCSVIKMSHILIKKTH
jgi:hypothetical protein